MASIRLLSILLTLFATALQTACEREDTITIKNETFAVEYAVTEAQRTQGMSGRESFPDQTCMLFVFPSSQMRSFWMYRCLINIDVAFLDANGVVVATHRMPKEPPQRADESDFAYESRLPKYSSRRPAQFALEFEAGTLDRLNIRVDDRIDLDLKRLKAMAE